MFSLTFLWTSLKGKSERCVLKCVYSHLYWHARFVFHDLLTINFMIGLCSGLCLPRLSSSIEASLFWFIWTCMILSLLGLKPILIKKKLSKTPFCILNEYFLLFLLRFDTRATRPFLRAHCTTYCLCETQSCL